MATQAKKKWPPSLTFYATSNLLNKTNVEQRKKNKGKRHTATLKLMNKKEVETRKTIQAKNRKAFVLGLKLRKATSRKFPANNPRPLSLSRRTRSSGPKGWNGFYSFSLGILFFFDFSLAAGVV